MRTAAPAAPARYAQLFANAWLRSGTDEMPSAQFRGAQPMVRTRVARTGSGCAATTLIRDNAAQRTTLESHMAGRSRRAAQG